MYEIIRTKKADRDLEARAYYIAKDNPYKALSFVQEMLDNFHNIFAMFPLASIKYEKYHCHTYKNYLIFYKVNKEKKIIHIMHIVHSAQYTVYKNFSK